MSRPRGVRSTVNQLRFHLAAFGDGLAEFVRQQTYENETDGECYPLRYRLRWATWSAMPKVAGPQ